MIDFVFLAARQIEPQPGFIVGPIAALFGHVINFLFNIVHSVSPVHALGFTIILMTIIFRAALMPLGLKAQKSMMKMRELKPELDKIQEKYGKSKDPEIVKKANAEKAALMAKHDANPLKGCFPMLLQMPLFIGLTFILRQSFLYITRLRELYYELSAAIINYPNFISIIAPNIANSDDLPDYVANATRLIPNAMQQNAVEAANLINNHGYTIAQARDQVGDFINLNDAADLSRVINRFTSENWEWLSTQIPETYWSVIAQLNERREVIESFFGLSVIEQSNWRWPAVLIPVLVAISMLCSSWLMQLRTADPNADSRVKMQQKIMLVVMPLVMAFFTVGFPVGVGLFWITSQIFQIVQDLILNKKAGIPMQLPFIKKE